MATAGKAKLLPHITVQPYSVLGTQLKKEGKVVAHEDGEPDETTALVDPAGLRYISELGPAKAGGAAGIIYKWLGIRDDPEFPDPVREAITAPMMAKFHAYGPKKCIHVVGPDFQAFQLWDGWECAPGQCAFSMPADDMEACRRQCEERDCGAFTVIDDEAFFKAMTEKECREALTPAPDAATLIFQDRKVTREQAVHELAESYKSILAEFVDSGLPCLRLLPVSGGIFAGPFMPEIPELTAEALEQGFAKLEPHIQAKVLDSTSLSMCIFMEKELADFQRTIEGKA